MKKRSEKIEALLRLRVIYYDLLKDLAQSTHHSMSFVLCHMFLRFRKLVKNDDYMVSCKKLNYDLRRKNFVVRYLFHLRFNKFLQFAMKDFAFRYNFSFNYLCELILDSFYSLRINDNYSYYDFIKYLKLRDEHNFWIVREDYARFNLKKKKKEIK